METSVGERLRHARTLVPKLSARELSRLAGRPETQCALIEDRKQKTVQPDVLRPFAKALGVSMSWLALGEGEQPDADAVGAAVSAARQQHGAPADAPVADLTVEREGFDQTEGAA